MGYFQQHLLVFMAMSFAIAISPVFSVLGWEERYLPDPKVCWGEIFNKADGCVHDLYASVVNKKINMRFSAAKRFRDWITSARIGCLITEDSHLSLETEFKGFVLLWASRFRLVIGFITLKIPVMVTWGIE
ncbi:hypothetical protein F3Y22_tig00004457pilonHSYRG00043 [Hibiscus syriacus]|uniref:Uncharacterized protein n=1 Tax=Hibiscus syriacus TaxID=106335 RepID=A0A6A3CGX7_HIBSY|nr:hypothetical protein F3Y22_tig00004457pilonHSYRG00043 [Hibiscus syriacus]